MWKMRYFIYLHDIFCYNFYWSSSQLDFIARIWNCEDVDTTNTCKWNLIVLITLALAKYWSWSPSTILWTYLEDGMEMNQMILALENKLEYKGKGNVYLQGNNHGHTLDWEPQRSTDVPVVGQTNKLKGCGLWMFIQRTQYLLPHTTRSCSLYYLV